MNDWRDRRREGGREERRREREEGEEGKRRREEERERGKEKGEGRREKRERGREEKKNKKQSIYVNLIIYKYSVLNGANNFHCLPHSLISNIVARITN